MKKYLISALVVLSLSFTGCSDSALSKLGAFGSKHKIELLNCNGEVIKTWISPGKVLSEEGSDGYYFTNEATGELIEVTGTLIITQLK